VQWLCHLLTAVVTWLSDYGKDQHLDIFNMHFTTWCPMWVASRAGSKVPRCPARSIPSLEGDMLLVVEEMALGLQVHCQE
jgi:hypothetical protein